MLDDTPRCVDGEYASALLTLAEARAGEHALTSLDCDAPSGPVTFTMTNPTGHIGTLDMTTAGDVRSFDWVPNAGTLDAGTAISDSYDYTMTSVATGITNTAFVHFDVAPVADLAVSAATPGSIVVAPGGSEATLSATVTNTGPDTSDSAYIIWTFASNVKLVSATAPGSTCDLYPTDSGEQFVSCDGPGLAPGASRRFDVVVSLVPGQRGLTLPSSTLVTTSLDRQFGGSTIDSNGANNNGSTTIQLTAATCTTDQTGTPPNCVTPPAPPTTCAKNEVGTPPNCIKPKAFVGGAGNKTYVGTAANDTFKGGKGNETFKGGAGNDTASGGKGNDKLLLGTGNDKGSGGDGNDIVDGGDGIDVLHGDAGNDKVLCGAGGKEKAYGDAGNDVVNCRDGKPGDTVSGGPGKKDTCIGDKGDIFVGCEKKIVFAIKKK